MVWKVLFIGQIQNTAKWGKISWHRNQVDGMIFYLSHLLQNKRKTPKRAVFEKYFFAAIKLMARSFNCHVFCKKSDWENYEKLQKESDGLWKIFLGGNQVDLAASDVTQCVKLVE